MMATEPTRGEVDDVDAKEGLASEPSPAQELVLRLVAEWCKPAEIMEAVAEAELAQGITLGWVKKVSSPACRPAWAKPLVAQYRTEYLASQDSIPGRHQCYRLGKLQELLDNTKSESVRLKALEALYEQSGDRVRKIQDVTATGLHELLKDVQGDKANEQPEKN